MQASQTCYSSTGQLNTTNPAQFAAVAGHGGVGIVEEVGRLVKRVKVGDQVMLATTPNCGVCWNCLSGRGDLCNTRLPAIPNADHVRQHAGLHDRAAGRSRRLLGVHRLGRGLGRAALHEGAGRGVVAPRVCWRNRPWPGHVPLSDRSRIGCGDLRAWPDRYQRRAGRAHSRCEDDHRDRPDQVPPRSGDETRRHARARSECRQGQRSDHQDSFAHAGCRDARPPLRRRAPGGPDLRAGGGGRDAVPSAGGLSNRRWT